MDDAKIVDMYWDRNEDAIVCTQQKYGAYLLKIARNILSDTQDSEECVNDTYLAAWNSMPVNRPKVLSTYLGKIVRQLSIDVFRKKTSLKRGGSEYELSYEELAEAFIAFVRERKPKLAALAELKVDELNLTEAAKELDKAISTVDSQTKKLEELVTEFLDNAIIF